jgi:hypothetical protein
MSKEGDSFFDQVREKYAETIIEFLKCAESGDPEDSVTSLDYEFKRGYLNETPYVESTDLRRYPEDETRSYPRTSGCSCNAYIGSRLLSISFEDSIPSPLGPATESSRRISKRNKALALRGMDKFVTHDVISKTEWIPGSLFFVNMPLDDFSTAMQPFEYIFLLNDNAVHILLGYGECWTDCCMTIRILKYTFEESRSQGWNRFSIYVSDDYTSKKGWIEINYSEEKRREMLIAMGMGAHHRLGSSSILGHIDPMLLNEIMQDSAIGLIYDTEHPLTITDIEEKFMEHGVCVEDENEYKIEDDEDENEYKTEDDEDENEYKTEDDEDEAPTRHRGCIMCLKCSGFVLSI